MLYLKYLKKLYLPRNTSELIRNSANETFAFSYGVMDSILMLISDLIILAIVIFLIFYNPVATIVSAIIIVLFGFLMMIFQIKKLQLYGKIRLDQSSP